MARPDIARHRGRTVARHVLYAASVVSLIAMPPVPQLGKPLLSNASSIDAQPSGAQAAHRRPETSLWVDMRNVNLHVDARNVMQVRVLRGQVIPTAPAGIPSLDDPTSFMIRATSGVVALDGDAITALLNEVVFNYSDAPIKHLTVRIEGGQLVQTGVLHKGVDIAFEMRAVPELQPDGKLRLHPNRLHILGVNGLTLMHAIGLHLSKLMDLSRAHGASIIGDDLYLDPLKITPPPLLEGHLSSVRIEGDVLVQAFTKTADDTVFGTYVRPDSGTRNFVYFRGGTLRLGRLTMTDTDLLIHDADEHDPFDLYLAEYKRQLSAGYTKTLANGGMRTWMVDYGKLKPSAAKGR